MARDNEFEGTGGSDTGASGGGGGSGVIDPATLVGNAGTTGDGFDPTIHVGRDSRNADGSFRRKRGRKSGSGGSAKSASSRGDLKAAVDTLSNTLKFIHLGIAGAVKVPELALEQSESDMLAGSIVNVMDAFDIRPDPRAEAVVGLIVAASAVYGPRVYLIKHRRASENARPQNGGEVVDFSGVKMHGNS